MRGGRVLACVVLHGGRLRAAAGVPVLETGLRQSTLHALEHQSALLAAAGRLGGAI